MRRKKHKHTRRAVKFYKIHHGFREPYKVCTVLGCSIFVAVSTMNIGPHTPYHRASFLQVVLDSSFVHGLLQAK